MGPASAVRQPGSGRIRQAGPGAQAGGPAEEEKEEE